MFVGALHHRRAILHDAAAMKRGLRQASLPSPEITFTDQQALPQQAFGHVFGQRAFVKFRMLHDGNLLDVFRKVQQDSILFEDADADDVAVLASQAHQRGQRVAQHLKSQPEQRRALRVRAVGELEFQSSPSGRRSFLSPLSAEGLTG